MTTCHRCADDLRHCHGTLVLHDDGAAECTEPGCPGDPVMHDVVLTCGSDLCGCCAAVGLRRAG
jgi:hypothetical protein